MTTRVLLLLACSAVLTVICGCPPPDSSPPINVEQYKKAEETQRVTWPKGTVSMYNRRRITDPNLSTEERIKSLELLEYLGEQDIGDQGELAEILTNPDSPPELKQIVLRILLKRDHPGLAVHVVKALPNMSADNELREAILTWLAKHPQPAVLSEIVKQWADETSITSPDEPRYRLIVERISGTGWEEALLEGINTPEFFARGSALEILAKRVDTKILRDKILQIDSKTEAMTVLQTFIQGFDYLPANQQELLSAVTVYKLDNDKLQRTAQWVRTWTTDFGYRFNIRDFHLISRLAYDPLRPKMLRIPLVLELKKKLDERDHAHAKQGGYEGTGHHVDEFMLQLETLSIADLWNIYLLDEMLKRPRVQVALRLMAEKDRDDRRTAWGGLNFYENGHAEAILYPPSLEYGENDLMYRPRKTTINDSRDCLCRFHAHFEKVDNSDRIGPDRLELLAAKQENFYGLVLTSLSNDTFCAHYYNPAGAVVSLGKFNFKKWP